MKDGLNIFHLNQRKNSHIGGKEKENFLCLNSITIKYFFLMFFFAKYQTILSLS